MNHYKRIGVTVKSDIPHKDAVVQSVLKILKKSGAEILVDRDRLRTIPAAKGLKMFKNAHDIDLLLILGGDGTILRTVREMECFSVPILSVNRGNIGFLAEMSVQEAPKLLPKFLRGEGLIDERSVLRVVARRGSKTIIDGFVLNEAVISQGTIARLIDLKTTVNGEPLTTFRADGLILSTPTGSTAYTLAAGGPILHPQVQATILTPINSYSFSQKPIVIPADHRVDVEVLGRGNKFGGVDVSLTLDGQTYVALHSGDVISATVNAHTVKFLRRKKETYYATLRSKLKWGERPEE
ncbi:MAG: NAD(+)/NADH kinase [Candidatus Peribacteraceae bacterium]|nr:NAD(+)/NADH kinase [Candidatus Peribacteraceae bacterium]